MFEVSLRTIYRDIAAINASGIPVTTIPGAGGGIGIMEQYKIEKGIFTADDISAMLTGLGIMQNTLSGREITNALAKLKSFISDDQIHDINRKTMRIMFDLSPWIGGEDSGELIRALKSALEKKRTISFSYFGRRGTEQFHGVESHRLVFKGNQWYLQAYLPANQEYRLLKLRRIYHVHIETDTYASRVLPHPYNDFTDRMGYKTIPVKLLIDSSALHRMLDYCTMDDVAEAGNGKYTVSLNFVDDDYGYGILMSFGDKLVCIEPDFVRLELMKRLDDALRQYAR